MNELPKGTVTSPKGFSAGVAACGLKESSNPDMALLVSARDCTAAGVFTQNQVVAAPVVVSRETLATQREHMRGVVINAGNANACTGEPGLISARAMQALAAGQLDCAPDQMLVLSTGVIGVQLDMHKVEAGIVTASIRRSAGGGEAAARAIMTTDTHPKQLAVQLELPGGLISIGGMAKGSGMIHPNMATMLGVITTDAAVPADSLQACLSAAVESSFNRISVDGDTSTNDAVLLLANGASGVTVTDAESVTLFSRALTHVCTQLAQMIVRDGEGATKFVELTVTGMETEAGAMVIAQTIATSPLVKTALAGGDPNWGRILAAAGRAGVPFDQGQVSLAIGAGKAELQLVAGGTPLDYHEDAAGDLFGRSEIWIRLSIGSGSGTATVWTCDLTHGYVSINADYRT